MQSIYATDLTKASRAAIVKVAPLKLTMAPSAPGFKRDKIKIAAALGGVKLDVVEAATDGELAAVTPLARTCVLEGRDGPVTRSNAVLRYVGGLNPAAELRGSTCFEEGLVDSWLAFGENELEVSLLAAAAHAHAPAVVAAARVSALAALKSLDAALRRRTYVAGDRPTIADCALVCLVAASVEGGLVGAGDLGGSPAALRWYLAGPEKGDFNSSV